MKNIVKHILVGFFLLYFSNAFAQLTKESVADQLMQLKNTLPKERVFLITDRDIYANDDVLWFSGITYDFFKNEIVHLSQEMTINLFNSSNLLVNSVSAVVKDGMASGSLKIPQGLNDGIYFIEAHTSNSPEVNNYSRKILIKNRIAPPIVIEAHFQDKKYFLGDQLDFSINFMDFYHEPIKKVSFQVDFYDGERKINGQACKTGKEGKAIIQYQIPTNLQSGFLAYKIKAEEKRQSTSHSGIIPVSSKDIFIDFYPINGFMVNGLETEVFYYAYSSTGEALQLDADLMESDQLIASIKSDENGIGSFQLMPKLDTKYYITIKDPVKSDKQYMLPEVHPKGLALCLLEQDDQMVKYQLKNGYIDPRLVYLVGQSKGEIIWFSEHEVVDEIVVDVDLSDATTGVVQFALINAAERLEGEHILWVDKNNEDSIEITMQENFIAQKRSKVSLKADVAQSGRLIFTAVNNPWYSSQLANHKACVLAYPYDFLEEPFSVCNSFVQKANDKNAIKAYLHLYTPRIFCWSKILDTEADLEQPMMNNQVGKNIYNLGMVKAIGSERHESGMIFQNNLTGTDYFFASNPQYFREDRKELPEQTPSYKILLQNGTPILQVLKLFKPFNLMGNKIVFLGSNNSLNYQDGALIVMDGVNRGTDATVLNGVSPYDVESINVSTDPGDIHRYTGLNSVGLIEIELKKGPKMLSKAAPENEVSEFVAPNYNKNKLVGEPDYRTTLYWLNKSIPSPQNEEIIYFNSDFISDVVGKLIFFPEKGIPQEQTIDYRIR